MSSKSDKTLKMWRLAVLESLKTTIPAAAEMFDVDEKELSDRQLLFLLEVQHTNHSPQPADPNARPHWTEMLHQSPLYELAMKVGLTLSMALIFWVMPVLLKAFVDPLTNTIIWAGFTTLYLLSFISLGIELIFWAGHHVNFRFFNRFYDPGVYDYESFLTGNKLTDYEKCKINQQKYLCYCGLAAYILGQLLSLLVPA